MKRRGILQFPERTWNNEPMTAHIDQLFSDPDYSPETFLFDNAVTAVFEDMIQRSVPMYAHLQHLIVDLTRHFAQPDTYVLDFGCSTGTTLVQLAAGLAHSIQLRGYDNSEQMLEKARLKAQNQPRLIEWQYQDLNKITEMPQASVAILNLVLQFLHPDKRGQLVRLLSQHIVPGGAAVVIEKISPEHEQLGPLWTQLYHQFKQRQGYSELEIAKKHKALTQVLIPWKASQTQALFRDAGFSMIEPIFQWQHFMGFIAIK